MICFFSEKICSVRFRKKGACAAAAWLVVEKPDEWTKSRSDKPSGVAHVLAYGAIFLGQGCASSFMAEAIALDEAARVVQSRMDGSVLQTVGLPMEFETASYREIKRI